MTDGQNGQTDNQDELKVTASAAQESNQEQMDIDAAAQAQIGRRIDCLENGFVRLVDFMGNDAAIVQAARVSYGAGTKRLREDRGLIRYLMRHAHTTPFEMVEFKFHVKLPVFVARQWIRHRTANVNEYSGRYSEMPDQFYLPEAAQIRSQSAVNRQGRSEDTLPEAETEKILQQLEVGQQRSYAEYLAMLETGFARELARIHLPLSVYTEWYWKIDLHNLFHFLHLRLDDHAQFEIRVFAEAMADIVKNIVPLAWEAYEDYRLQAIRMTRCERIALKKLLGQRRDNELDDAELTAIGLSKREIREFRRKLADLDSLL